MNGEMATWKRVFGALLLASALGFAAAGCADVRPEANDTGGGVLGSPTDEADQLREDEDRGRGGLQ